jgi:hypothetical protein
MTALAVPALAAAARPLHRVECACAWVGYRRHPHRRTCPNCQAPAVTLKPVWLAGCAPRKGHCAYLAHISPPYRHAEHYAGFTIDLPTRWRDHLAGGYDPETHRNRGKGARLLAAGTPAARSSWSGSGTGHRRGSWSSSSSSAASREACAPAPVAASSRCARSATATPTGTTGCSRRLRRRRARGSATTRRCGTPTGSGTWPSPSWPTASPRPDPRPHRSAGRTSSARAESPPRTSRTVHQPPGRAAAFAPRSPS